jgi:hypothetical protein
MKRQFESGHKVVSFGKRTPQQGAAPNGIQEFSFCVHEFQPLHASTFLLPLKILIGLLVFCAKLLRMGRRTSLHWSRKEQHSDWNTLSSWHGNA